MLDRKPLGGDLFRFNLRQLFLATAFAGITFAAWRKGQVALSPNLRRTADCLVLLAPCWLPFLFASYAIGRRRLSIALLVIFAVAEIVSLIVLYRDNHWDLIRLIRS